MLPPIVTSHDLKGRFDWLRQHKDPLHGQNHNKSKFTAIMANPRKFSEKIALHNQKQAEETAAFEAIIRDVSAATRVSGSI